MGKINWLQKYNFLTKRYFYPQRGKANTVEINKNKKVSTIGIHFLATKRFSQLAIKLWHRTVQKEKWTAGADINLTSEHVAFDRQS